MGIYLDDVAVKLDGRDLGQALTEATRRLEPAGRIVVEVKVDGQALVGAELERRQHDCIAGREVHLYTAAPRELSVQTLRQVGESLQTVRQQQAEAAELLQQDRPSEAMQRVGQVLETWMATQQAVVHCAQLTGVPLDDVVVNEQPLPELIDALLKQFQDLKALLTSSDTVGLADALAYEWPQTVDAWDGVLEELMGRIGEGR